MCAGVLLSKVGRVFSFFILFANKMKYLIVMCLYDYFLLTCAGRSPLWSAFAREKNPEIEYMLLSVTLISIAVLSVELVKILNLFFSKSCMFLFKIVHSCT